MALTTSFRSLAARSVLCCWGLSACSAGDGEWQAEATEGDLGTLEQPIEQGDQRPDSDVAVMHVVEMERLNGSTLGSGAFLRNDWVLTAAHLFPADRIASPSTTFRVRYGAELLTPTEVVVHPGGLDVALVRLATGASINGARSGFARAMHTGTAASLAGLTLDCWGYGAFAADETGAGTLRQGFLRVASSSSGVFYIERNGRGQLMTAGDSGGVCYHQGQAVGVHHGRDRMVNGVWTWGVETPTHAFAKWAIDEVMDRRVTAELRPAEGSWGSWYGPTYCPPNHYAVSYRMRVEPSQGGGDDTSLNSVELECRSVNGASSKFVTSHSGFWGNWNVKAACRNDDPNALRNFLDGARLKVEPSQGSGDDTGANDATFTCTGGDVVQAPGGRSYGNWSAYATCPSGSAVCGISTRVESQRGGGDDTAMNGLRLTCCQVAAPAPACASPINESWSQTLGSEGSAWVGAWGDAAVDAANQRLRLSYDDVVSPRSGYAGSYYVSHKLNLSGGTVFTPYPYTLDLHLLPSIRRSGNGLQLGGDRYGGEYWSNTDPAGFAGRSVPNLLSARVTTYVKRDARQLAVKVEAAGIAYRSGWSAAFVDPATDLGQLRLVGENNSQVYFGADDYVFVGRLGGCSNLTDAVVEALYNQ